MNATDNVSILNPLTIGLDSAELWIHIIGFYLILCGVFSTLGYVLVAVGIARDKKLRTRFFVVLWSLVLCRALLCAQFFVVGIYRSLRTARLAPIRLSNLACNAVHFWLLIGLTLEITLLLILVLERAVALTMPAFYRLLTTRQAVFICATTYFVVLVLKLPFVFVDSNPGAEISCVNSYSAPSDAFDSYSQNIDLVALCLTLSIYLMLLAFVKYKIYRLRRKNQGRDAAADGASIALKRQLELMPTLRHLVLVHCLLSFVSRILRTTAGLVEDNPYLAARFIAYGGLFTTIDLFTNLLALLSGNADVRNASLPWCFKKKNRVGPAAPTNSEKRWAKMTNAIRFVNGKKPSRHAVVE